MDSSPQNARWRLRLSSRLRMTSSLSFSPFLRLKTPGSSQPSPSPAWQRNLQFEADSRKRLSIYKNVPHKFTPSAVDLEDERKAEERARAKGSQSEMRSDAAAALPRKVAHIPRGIGSTRRYAQAANGRGTVKPGQGVSFSVGGMLLRC